MSDFLHIIETSMLNDIYKISVSSNNVSNISTNGYKRDVVVGDSFNAHIKSEYFDSKRSLSLSSGSGLKTITDLRLGNVVRTGDSLNFVISGDGFFSIEKNGDIVLTRDGSFTLNESGYLVTRDGFMVRGDTGYIRLTTNTPTLSDSGELFDEGKAVSKIQVVQIQDSIKSLLQKDGDGYLEVNGALLQYDENVEIIQGFVEKANVDGAFEMINTMETMRHFELTQRLLKMNQEMFKSGLEALGNY